MAHATEHVCPAGANYPVWLVLSANFYQLQYLMPFTVFLAGGLQEYRSFIEIPRSTRALVTLSTGFSRHYYTCKLSFCNKLVNYMFSNSILVNRIQMFQKRKKKRQYIYLEHICYHNLSALKDEDGTWNPHGEKGRGVLSVFATKLAYLGCLYIPRAHTSPLIQQREFTIEKSVGG